MDEENNRIKDSDVKDSEMEKSNIEDSKLEESKIRDSDIEDSQIKDSEIRDSSIENSQIIGGHIEDSNIEDSKIIEENLEKKNRIEPVIKEQKIVSVDTRELIEQRKKKILNFFKGKQVWVLGFLIIALILGIYIRSMPMQDHGGNPGLWDIATNTWTLGPDLDPWLFERYAKTIIEQGFVPKTDMMRNVPLGFDTLRESMVLSYMIVGVYYLFHFFNNSINVEFAAAILPVIMFAFTIIAFFFFVREIFIKKTKESMIRANIIALISTFFMIVIPAFLSRTIAGIPEKESVAFFFMFLAFYLFLKAWKQEKLKMAIIFGVLAGIITGLMGLVWGGYIYVAMTISFSTLFAFIIGKIKKKEIFIYCSWVISATLVLLNLFSTRYHLLGLVTSINGMYIAFFILLIHFILWNTKLSKIKIFSKILFKFKIPKTIISLIVFVILVIIVSSIFISPDFIIVQIKNLIETLINPTTGRWGITVAENRQPYFIEWASSFGPFLKGIPVLFWLFFIGSIVFFKKTFNKLKKKESWILTGLYTFFLFGLIFSRYSTNSIFNGANFISKLFYFGSLLLFFSFIFYYYIQNYRKDEKDFIKIDFNLLFLLFLLIITLISVRSAIRLIMVLAPIAPIFVGYLIVSSVERFRKTESETWKIVLGMIIILILLLSIFSFWNFYKIVKAQAYSFVPSHYNQQWQKAMQWVRNETPKDSVFSHWWDYGYWVQSIGNRATVVDGGNAITYWNYLMGRYVLTGDNQKDALEFLYNHDTTHLLIDPTDIGKYTAYSSIGSDENYDRYSWIGTFLLDEKKIGETKNQTIYFYSGSVALDEDLMIKRDEKDILLPRQGAGIGALILPIEKSTNKYLQPHIIAIYQGKQYKINLKYLNINGEFIIFEEGIEATAYIFPKMIQQGGQVGANPIGSAIFISPRLMRGMFSNIYLLNDPLDKFSNFKLVHSEPNLIIDSLSKQGMNLPEFVYYQGIQGPIKIWEIEYIGEEKIKEEYLDKDASKYLDWIL